MGCLSVNSAIATRGRRQTVCKCKIPYIPTFFAEDKYYSVKAKESSTQCLVQMIKEYSLSGVISAFQSVVKWELFNTNGTEEGSVQLMYRR